MLFVGVRDHTGRNQAGVGNSGERIDHAQDRTQDYRDHSSSRCDRGGLVRISIHARKIDIIFCAERARDDKQVDRRFAF